MNLGMFELHLSPNDERTGGMTLPALFGKAIRALGGSYSECRGYREQRTVMLPISDVGIAMALDLLDIYPNPPSSTKPRGTTVVITRPKHGPARVWYARSATAEKMFAQEHGHARGLLHRAAFDADRQRAQLAERRPASLREERARLLARIAEINAELGE